MIRIRGSYSSRWKQRCLFFVQPLGTSSFLDEKSDDVACDVQYAMPHLLDSMRVDDIWFLPHSSSLRVIHVKTSLGRARANDFDILVGIGRWVGDGLAVVPNQDGSLLPHGNNLLLVWANFHLPYTTITLKIQLESHILFSPLQTSMT